VGETLGAGVLSVPRTTGPINPAGNELTFVGAIGAGAVDFARTSGPMKVLAVGLLLCVAATGPAALTESSWEAVAPALVVFSSA
jgi:hypothetical protein